jgi:hypothetical protein
MTSRRRIDDDRGSAVLEFIVVGVLVLIPIAYLVLSVMRVQAAVFASTQAVREAARAFVTADSATRAQQRAVSAARLAFVDQGFALPAQALTVRCRPTACLTPGGTIDVEANWAVPLPWLPATFGDVAAVPIRAAHTLPVDTYRVVG